MSEELIEGGLYSYPAGVGWCKHGIVRLERIKGVLMAVDTYWNNVDTFHQGIEAESIKDKLTFLIDMKECRNSNEHEWQQFENNDRAYIPIGGGSERWLVLKSAKPSIELQLKQLCAEVDVAEGEISTAVWTIARKHEEIALLRAKLDPVNKAVAAIPKMIDILKRVRDQSREDRIIPKEDADVITDVLRDAGCES